MTDIENKKKGCLFCGIQQKDIIEENELAIAIKDNYPVTKFHTLIIPKRHIEDYFDLSKEEIRACNILLKYMRDDILKDDSNVEGFNIGVNSGSVAGQTVFHCHIHLIPRRAGDVDNPRGGVRGVIPSRQDY